MSRITRSPLNASRQMGEVRKPAPLLRYQH
jgi:hypothetical protein